MTREIYTQQSQHGRTNTSLEQNAYMQTQQNPLRHLITNSSQSQSHGSLLESGKTAPNKDIYPQTEISNFQAPLEPSMLTTLASQEQLRSRQSTLPSGGARSRRIESKEQRDNKND